MKRILFLAVYCALSLDGLAQSSMYNPIYKPNLFAQIPFVQPLESTGYETNIVSHWVMDTNSVPMEISTTNITAKLNPFRTLKFCDFVLKAIDNTDAVSPLKYVYSSSPLWNTGGLEDTAAKVYYQNSGNAWPSCAMKTEFIYDGMDSIQIASDNSAAVVECWPDRIKLAQAGITERSRNISWMCLLLNGVDTYNDFQSGEPEWFPVSVEWRQFAPNY